MVIISIGSYLLQFTWGLIQNVLGFLLLLYFLIMGKQISFLRYKSAIIIFQKGAHQGISLGIFIFISGHDIKVSVEALKKHEYGHTIQSALLGPLYLLVIGIPSIFWCNFPALNRYRQKNKLNYDVFYTERWATYLGNKF